jgi:hypothetical protein
MSLERAWAAGFFDGEGWIGYNTYARSSELRLAVFQVDRFVLDRFRAAVGVGTVFGPYPQKGGQPGFSYRAGGPLAQQVVVCLWSYLSPIKRAQAGVALKAWAAAKFNWQECAALGHEIRHYISSTKKRTFHYCLPCRRAYYRAYEKRRNIPEAQRDLFDAREIRC